jgi:hypothetical protein
MRVPEAHSRSLQEGQVPAETSELKSSSSSPQYHYEESDFVAKINGGCVFDEERRRSGTEQSNCSPFGQPQAMTSPI